MGHVKSYLWLSFLIRDFSTFEWLYEILQTFSIMLGLWMVWVIIGNIC